MTALAATPNSDEVFLTRVELQLTQAQLAAVLGVHVLTVSKWERGALAPTPRQLHLLRLFRVAPRKAAGVVGRVAAALLDHDPYRALWLLLDATYKES